MTEKIIEYEFKIIITAKDELTEEELDEYDEITNNLDIDIESAIDEVIQETMKQVNMKIQRTTIIGEIKR